MSWVKIDDRIFLHRKFRCSDAARLMYFAGLAYAAQAESDGVIVTADLPVVAAYARTVDASGTAAELVRIGLWEMVEGGYQIHDYLEYQPSRAHIEAERKRKREWAASNSGASSASNGQSNSATVAASRSRSPSRSGSPSPNQDTCPSAAAPGRARARRAEVSEAFARIWAIYPRRDAKAKAAVSWTRQARDYAGGEAALADAVTSALAWQVPHWQATDREYPAHVPYLASYLHQQRWTDERTAAARPQARPGQPAPYTWPDLPGLGEVGT